MGLARYTAWLMLAARLAIGAQAQGIAEAALRESIKYAREREQFGKPIRDFPQVGAMLANMRMMTEASRAVLYATSEIVDLHQAAEKRGLKEETRLYGKYAEALTPMAKYFTTEVANRTCYDAIQIHGGNGFMKDYPVERLYRDVRITNIYEGTSQIQVNWAISRLIRGDLDEIYNALAALTFEDSELNTLSGKVNSALTILKECLAFLKEREISYRELVGPPVVDIALDVYSAYLLLKQASLWNYKKAVAARYIQMMLPRIRMNREYALHGQLADLNP
jgi:hypothetical protein